MLFTIKIKIWHTSSSIKLYSRSEQEICYHHYNDLLYILAAQIQVRKWRIMSNQCVYFTLFLLVPLFPSRTTKIIQTIMRPQLFCLMRQYYCWQIFYINYVTFRFPHTLQNEQAAQRDWAWGGGGGGLAVNFNVHSAIPKCLKSNYLYFYVMFIKFLTTISVFRDKCMQPILHFDSVICDPPVALIEYKIYSTDCSELLMQPSKRRLLDVGRVVRKPHWVVMAVGAFTKNLNTIPPYFHLVLRSLVMRDFFIIAGLYSIEKERQTNWESEAPLAVRSEMRQFLS